MTSEIDETQMLKDSKSIPKDRKDSKPFHPAQTNYTGSDMVASPTRSKRDQEQISLLDELPWIYRLTNDEPDRGSRDHPV